MTGFPVLDRIIEATPAEDREETLALLGDRQFAAEAVVAALARLGYSVSASTIRTYRRSLPHKEVRKFD